MNIVNVMSNAGFTRLVTSPTTDRGSLIDHVYCNFPLTNIVVEVSDVYYSDHDAVFVLLHLEVLNMFLLTTFSEVYHVN